MREPRPYTPPAVTEHGTLAQLTAARSGPGNADASFPQGGNNGQGNGGTDNGSQPL